MATGRQISDAKYQAFVDIGLIGARPENELQWLQANGATANQINDAWREMLIARTGLPAENYQRNDYWYALLGDMGYEGQRNDRELAFWLNGGTFESAPPVWTSTVPDFEAYENELPWTRNMNAYVYAFPAITGWATTKGNIDTGGILTVDDVPGDYPITVTATGTVTSELMAFKLGTL